MSLSGCTFGTITFELTEAGEGATTLTLSHRMIGDVDDENVAMYRSGWKTLIEENLRAYIATGVETWTAA